MCSTLTVWQSTFPVFPWGLLFFSVLQGCYFVPGPDNDSVEHSNTAEVGPAAIPAILYALARIPKYRMAAGSALATLGVLAVWPMHMERPYRTGGTAMAPRREFAVERALGVTKRRALLTLCEKRLYIMIDTRISWFFCSHLPFLCQSSLCPHLLKWNALPKHPWGRPTRLARLDSLGIVCPTYTHVTTQM